MNDNNVDKNSVSLSCRDEKKKIGDVNLKGIIEELKLTVLLICHFIKLRKVKMVKQKKKSKY